MPRRLDGHAKPQVWIAVLLTALLFAIALALALTRLGPDDSSVARPGTVTLFPDPQPSVGGS